MGAHRLKLYLRPSFVDGCIVRVHFHNKQYGLGAATTAAKIAAYSQNNFWGELVETFVLFGDPVTQLGVSTGSDAAVSLLAPDGGDVIAEGSTFTIQWSAPQGMVKFALKYSLNNGRTWKKITKKVEGTSYAGTCRLLKRARKAVSWRFQDLMNLVK